MANLYFRYSSMNSGKTLDLLKVAFNYEERGGKVVILTSKLDDRYGINKVKSRIGLERDAIGISIDDNITKKINDINNLSCILVDEVQFFTSKQIDDLSDIVDYYNVPVICYGLRADFKNELFEGSKRLLTIADRIEELRTVCWCGEKATVNARIIDGKIVTDGDQVQIGGNESYITLCRKHYKEKNLGNNE